MKKIPLTLTIIGFSLLLFSEQALAGKFKQIQVSQQARILQGARSGQLTRQETHALLHEQRRISDLRNVFWRDGHLSGNERHRLTNWQRRADRHIWRLKHNSHRRTWAGWRPHRHDRHYRWPAG